MMNAIIFGSPSSIKQSPIIGEDQTDIGGLSKKYIATRVKGRQESFKQKLGSTFPLQSPTPSYKLGRVDFINQKYFKALISFNNALIAAKKRGDSSLMPDIYYNRSILYFEAKQFDKCLENIQQSLIYDEQTPNYDLLWNIDQSEIFSQKAKLMKLEVMCKESLKNQTKFSVKDDIDSELKELFEMNYPSNEKIPFVANCVEFRKNYKGSGVYATRDLNPGDVIAVEDLMFPNLMTLDRRCTYCFQSNQLNLNISNQGVLFCSSKCAQAFDQRFEKFKIPTFPVFKHFAFNAFTLLTNNKYLKALEMCEGSDQLAEICQNPGDVTIFDFDLNNLKDLQTTKNIMKCIASMKKIRTDSSDTFSQIKENFPRTSHEQDSFFEFCKMDLEISPHNRVTFKHKETIHTDSLLLFGCLMNHSCDPNVMLVNVDQKVVSILTRPVKTGEQLFRSYGNKLTCYKTQRNQRREILKKKFDIYCTCEACEMGYLTIKDLLNSNSFHFRDVFEGVEDMLETLKGNWKEIIEEDENKRYQIEKGEDENCNNPMIEALLIEQNVRILKRLAVYATYSSLKNVETYKTK